MLLPQMLQYSMMSSAPTLLFVRNRAVEISRPRSKAPTVLSACGWSINALHLVHSSHAPVCSTLTLGAVNLRPGCLLKQYMERGRRWPTFGDSTATTSGYITPGEAVALGRRRDS